jgi:hypothetical protein
MPQNGGAEMRTRVRPSQFWGEHFWTRNPDDIPDQTFRLGNSVWIAAEPSSVSFLNSRVFNTDSAALASRGYDDLVIDVRVEFPLNSGGAEPARATIPARLC